MAQQIVIDIVAETKKLTQGLNNAETEIGSLNNKVKGLASAAGAAASAFVLKQGISFLKQGIEEAEDARKAMLNAESAFGKGSDALQKITKDAEKFGKALGMDNDDIIKLSTQLGSRLPKDAQSLSAELVNLGKDVEAFTGGAIDAETYTSKLAKAFSDGEISSKELRKIVPGLSDSVYDLAEKASKAGDNQKALTIIIDEAQKKYGDAAEKNVTSTQKFETALANFKEELGTKVLPILEKAVDFLTDLLNAFDKQPGWLKNFEIGLAGLIGVGGPLVMFVSKTKDALDNLGLLPGKLGAATTATEFFSGALKLIPWVAAIAAIILIIKHWDDIKEAATKLWEKIKEVFDNIKDKIVNALTDAKDWLEKNWPLILGVLTGPFGLFAAWIITHKEDLIAKFNDLWDKVKTAIGDKVTAIGTAVKDSFYNLFFKTIPGMFDKFTNLVTDVWDGIKYIVGQIVTKIFNEFGEVFGKMVDVGKAIAQGIWQGLSSMTGWFKMLLTGWVNANIPAAVRNILKISSPSKVMEQIGQYAVEGLYKGMGAQGPVGIQLPQINVPAGARAGGINITINAGIGTDPYALGREVSNAVKKYGRISRNSIQ